MSQGHFRLLYSCGHVHSQCRCPDPSKTVQNLDYPCASCVGKPQEKKGCEVPFCTKDFGHDGLHRGDKGEI